jgi:hypothetical protein
MSTFSLAAISCLHVYKANFDKKLKSLVESVIICPFLYKNIWTKILLHWVTNTIIWIILQK